ncbi:MAG TPA: polysaccharide deacetylase family protein, partial [Fimbriimonas sp.]|nr:polysaccharide deacetylase family protein [Fimbriimonas sp.]
MRRVSLSKLLMLGGALCFVAALFGLNARRGDTGPTFPDTPQSEMPAVVVDEDERRMLDVDRRIFFKGIPTRNEVCITFDDGPHPLSCIDILRTLKDKGVKAGFYVVGKQVDANPDLVREIAADGHELANHTYDHFRLDKLSKEEIISQITQCDRAVEKATGLKMNYFRPPGLRFNDDVISVLRQRKLLMVHYMIGAKDFFGSTPEHELLPEAQKLPAVTPENIVEYVVKQLRPGGIILLHDNPVTAKALPALIDAVRAKGYEFVTTEEMLDRLDVPFHMKSNTVSPT